MSQNVFQLKDRSLYHVRLLPGRCGPDYPHVDFHNRVYAFWRSFWEGVFRDNGCGSVPDANVFYRQDMVVVVMHADQIVGTFFFTENNVASDVTLGISYFDRPRIRELCESFRDEGARHVATCEMLSVSPEFRKRNTGLSFGLVLLALIKKAFAESRAHVITGPVRTDNGADVLMTDLGWSLVSEEYEMHGTPVRLTRLRKNEVRPHADEALQAFIDRLWTRRVDLRDAAAVPGVNILVA